MVLTSVESVIEAIGAERAAELADVGKSAVSNWIARGRIPARVFFDFLDELRDKNGSTADPELFGITRGETK